MVPGVCNVMGCLPVSTLSPRMLRWGPPVRWCVVGWLPLKSRGKKKKKKPVSCYVAVLVRCPSYSIICLSYACSVLHQYFPNWVIKSMCIRHINAYYAKIISLDVKFYPVSSFLILGTCFFIEKKCCRIKWSKKTLRNA